MKFRTLYTLFAILFVAALFTNFSAGPGASMQDRTGGPFAVMAGGQPSSCQTCHTGTAFNASMAVQLLDGGTPVTAYEPGQTYKLRYTVNHGAGSPAVFGFQSVVLTSGANANVGTFAAAPSGMRVSTFSGRSYVEHSMPRSSNTFEIDWTAPAAGTGTIAVYAAGNAANGNGATSGDSGARTVVQFTEAVISSASEDAWPGVSVSVFPNPVQQVLLVDVEMAEAGSLQVSLTNAQGQLVSPAQLVAGGGAARHRIDVAHLPAGLYLLRLTDGTRSTVRKVLKQ